MKCIKASDPNFALRHVSEKNNRYGKVDLTALDTIG